MRLNFFIIQKFTFYYIQNFILFLVRSDKIMKNKWCDLHCFTKHQKYFFQLYLYLDFLNLYLKILRRFVLKFYRVIEFAKEEKKRKKKKQRKGIEIKIKV